MLNWMFKLILSTIALTLSISEFSALSVLALDRPSVFPLEQSQATPPESSDSPSGENQENQVPNPSDSFPQQNSGNSSPEYDDSPSGENQENQTPNSSDRPSQKNPRTTPPESSEYSDFPLEQNQPNQTQNNSEPSSQQRNQKITIPRSSAVTVTFCSNLQFDPQQTGSFPVTLFLARPILDSNGKVIAPVNTLVRAKLKPIDKKEDEEEDENQGFKIKPEALVIGGRFIPIETSSVSIPTLASVRQQNNYTYSSYGGQGWEGPLVQVADELVGTGGLLESQRVLDRSTSDLLSLGLAIASGVSAGLSQPEPPDPEDNKIMEVSEGIQLIFPLKSSVALPAVATHKNPYFANQAAAGSACSGSSGPSRSGNGNYYETNNQNRPNETNDSQTNNDRNWSYQRNSGTSDEYD
ncbi:MAG: hypothetical protein BRC45_03315 [Cyanobacteria bacterium QS_5_48_63]|nr:MAG: hypothetical protein BRC45_03315 [Cyanobacteria bacterium QS_5_48_63]